VRSWLLGRICDIICFGLLFACRKRPELELEALLKRNFTKVVFFKGSIMNTRDIERVKVTTAPSSSIRTRAAWKSRTLMCFRYAAPTPVFRSLHVLAPLYLSDDLHRLVDIPSRRRLRSSSSLQLDVPRTHRRTVGDRASLLPVRRSGTVCHSTLLTVCH